MIPILQYLCSVPSENSLPAELSSWAVLIAFRRNNLAISLQKAVSHTLWLYWMKASYYDSFIIFSSVSKCQISKLKCSSSVMVQLDVSFRNKSSFSKKLYPCSICFSQTTKESAVIWKQKKPKTSNPKLTIICVYMQLHVNT